MNKKGDDTIREPTRQDTHSKIKQQDLGVDASAHFGCEPINMICFGIKENPIDIAIPQNCGSIFGRAWVKIEILDGLPDCDIAFVIGFTWGVITLKPIWCAAGLAEHWNWRGGWPRLGG